MNTLGSALPSHEMPGDQDADVSAGSARRHRRLLGEWLLLAALLAVGGYAGYAQYQEFIQVDTRERERLLSQTALVEKNLALQMSSTRRALDGILENVPAWQLERTGPQQANRQLQLLADTQPGIGALLIINADGRVFSANDQELIGRNVSHRDYFQNARSNVNSQTLFVTSPFTTVLGTFVMGFYRSIRTPSGEFGGVVMASMNPKYFQTLMDSVRYAPDARSFLIHGDGQVFMVAPEQPGLNGRDLAVPGSMFTRHRNRDSDESFSVFADTAYISGEERMAAFRTIQPAGLFMDKPLVVAVSRDLNAIFAPWNRESRTRAGIFCALTLVSCLSLFVLQRRRRIHDDTAQAQEQALLGSAARLNEAQRIAQVGSWTLDLVSGELIWSDEVFRLFEIDSAQFSATYEGFLDAIHPEDRIAVNKAYADSLTTRHGYEITHRLQMQDGRVKWVHEKCVSDFDVDGKPLRSRGTVQDVTQRVLAEQAMRSSQARLHSLFDATPDAFLISDSDGKITLANQQVERLLGYSVDELTGSSIEILVPERFRAGHPTLRRIFGESPHARRMGSGLAIKARRKDGSEADVEISLGRIETEHELFFACGLRDITERKQAQAALAESEARFRSLAAMSSDFYWQSDSEHRLAERTESKREAAESVFREQSSIGKRRWEVPYCSPDEAGWQAHHAMLDAHLPFRDFKIARPRSNGTVHHLSISGDPMFDASGQFTGYRGAGSDITERMRAMEALQASEIFSLAILNSVAASVAVVDRSGTILRVNDSWRNFSQENASHPGQPSPQGGVGAQYFSAATDHPEGTPNPGSGARKGILAVLDGTLPAFTLEYPYHSPTRQRWFMMNVQPFGSNAQHGVVITHTDVTGVKERDEQLRIAAGAFESQASMMITDADGTILRVNRAFTESTGYTVEEVVGRRPSILKSGRHDKEFYRRMQEAIALTGAWQGEIWDRRKNGEVYPKWLTVSAMKADDGTVTHYIGTHNDITERKQAEARIEHLAFFDQLTKLPNRTLLMDRLKQTRAASSRNDSLGAVLFIDLDNFKTLNDTLGHDMGDKLLKQVAQRLQLCVRVGDTVARLGGDEFVVMLANLNANQIEAATHIEAVAGKIIRKLGESYRLDTAVVTSTASIGITIFRGRLDSIEDLMKQADLAMYKAKDAGRNTFRFFDPAMEAAVKDRAAVEEDLRQGLEQQQFLLHYQAQIGCDGQLTGSEVLVRWKHPMRGMVSPADFIPIAEETGLILPLGQWVMTTACRQLALWASRPEMAHLTLAVNVSARQLQQPNFVDQVLAVLKNTNANPQRLKLELTESLLVNNVQDIIEKMLVLKALGVGFSLDDFGTGYSSLSYLKRLPLDQLKIDQSFVRDVLTDPNGAAIARTVVALAHSLGLGVIAEGVETDEQRDFLARSGCHDYQGYFFSRPLPIDGFEAFAQNRMAMA